LRRHGGHEGKSPRGRSALRVAHGADAPRAGGVHGSGGHALAGRRPVRAARAAALAGEHELSGASGRQFHHRRNSRRGDRALRPRPARAGHRSPPARSAGIAHGPPDDDAVDRADGGEGDPGGGRALAAQRRFVSKNSRSSAPHSSASTPPSASPRWLSRGSSSSRYADSIPPPRGPGAPTPT